MSTAMANLHNAIRRRIRNGEKLLDSHFGPDWDERINLKSLDMGACKNCICGQLDFNENVTDNDRKKFSGKTKTEALLSSEHGFYSGYIPNYGIGYDIHINLLQKLWVKRIKDRQAERAVLKPFSLVFGSETSKISEFVTA